MVSVIMDDYDDSMSSDRYQQGFYTIILTRNVDKCDGKQYTGLHLLMT